MIFSSRNCIYQWALKQRLGILYGITGILCIGFGVAAWYTYNYIEQVMTAEHSQLVCLHGQCVQLYSTQEKQKKNIHYQEECDYKLKKYQFACHPLFKQEQLQTIIEQARKKGVKITELQVQKEKNKEWCVRNDIELRLKGTIAQIIDLLISISQQHKLIQCKHISCAVDQNGLYSALCTIGCLRINNL